MVEGAPPPFLPLVRHRAGGGGAPQWSHHLPSPVGGRSLHSDPCGKAIELMRKPKRPHRRQLVRYAHETGAQAATTRTWCGSKQVPSRYIAQARFSSRSANERSARA